MLIAGGYIIGLLECPLVMLLLLLLMPQLLFCMFCSCLHWFCGFLRVLIGSGLGACYSCEIYVGSTLPCF